jgi:serine/threonine protein kinase
MEGAGRVEKGTQLDLARKWIVGEAIGAGGFGRVYVVEADGEEAVAKLVPKAPGADRELLFVDLQDARNIVTVIDSGETMDEWVLVMPRAERSLRELLDSQADHRIDSEEAVRIMMDLAAALTDLDGRVVHRDLKPENVLFLGGAWCLADFGISRYAEATTALDTRKFALSPPYAAPERWRSERATSATDIYSLGVIGYEMISGSRPFPGPGIEDWRD